VTSHLLELTKLAPWLMRTEIDYFGFGFDFSNN